MKVKIKIPSINLIIALAFTLNISLLVYLHNTAYKIALVSFGVVFILITGILEKKTRFPYFVLGFLAFVIWAAFSYIWHTGKYNVNILIILVLIAVFEVIIYNVLSWDANYIIILIDAIIIGSVVLAIYIVSFYGLGSMLSERFGNDVLNSNRAGSIFSIAAVFSLFLRFKKELRSYYIPFGFLAIMVFLSGSKGSVIDLTIGTTALLVFKDRNKIGITIRNILIAAALFVAAFYLMTKVPVFYNIIGRRMMDFLDIVFGKTKAVAGMNSNYMRLTMILFGIQKFKESPLIGYGLDSFRWLGLYETYSHSNIIEILVDLGIVGAVFYYSQYIPLVRVVVVERKKMSSDNMALLIGFIVRLIVRNIVGVYYNELYDYVIFIIMLRIAEEDKFSIEEKLYFHSNNAV